MAYDYISEADIENRLWRKTADLNAAKVLGYISQANVEVEDLAIKKDLTVDQITVPIHSKLDFYAQNYALRQFAADRIGLNVQANGKDVYKDLFDRSQYLMNLHKPDLTETVFTQKNQNSTNRASNFGRVKRR